MIALISAGCRKTGVHRLGMTPSILAELDLGGGAEAERLILVRNVREPRYDRILRRRGLSVAAVQEAKPPASFPRLA